jgi:short-subunit dehydrogenase
MNYRTATAGLHLAHPVVVLTGASSGIGRATALTLAASGARLMLVARGREALDAVAAECTNAGARVATTSLDVADAAAVSALADETIARYGKIDVWINNVGVGAVGRFDETPVEAHRRVIESNLIGHVNGSHAALKYFREFGRGVLINMISIGGWLSAPYAAAYTASKFGLRGLGQSLRAEVSDLPDVHVCDVYPGFVDTPGVSHGANYTGRQLRPMPPLLRPETVASRIVSLIENPRPVVAIGSTAHAARYTYGFAPEVRGSIARRLIDFALSRASPVSRGDGNLFEASLGSSIEGGFRRRGTRVALVGVAALALAGLAWKAMHYTRRLEAG